MTVKKLAEVLLVEDNLGDVELTKDALSVGKFRNNLHVTRDGEEALDFLHKRNGYEDAPTPNIILLDLNLPKTDGKEVLKDIKNSPKLKRIPIIIMTSSKADRDILDTYSLYANCYVTKPVDCQKFVDIVQKIEDFWIEVVCLPKM